MHAKRKHEDPQYTLRVGLNGTDENPWHRLGLTQNPFPQIATAEMSGACLRVQKLDGPPIPHDRYAEYIRDTLRGFNPEFVDLCIQKFEPGKRVRFEVTWPVDAPPYVEKR